MALDDVAALLRSAGASARVPFRIYCLAQYTQTQVLTQYRCVLRCCCSTAIKKRLEGVTALAELLRAHATDVLTVATDDLAALLPDVLPCLRDHNSKVVSSALESLDVMLAHVPQSTVQSYYKVLWLNLVEKLGDSKVRAPAIARTTACSSVRALTRSPRS